MERPKKLGYYKELLPKRIYNIYCDCYWANHQYSIEKEKEEILELSKNRETLADLYKLKKQINIPKKHMLDVVVIDYNDYERYKRNITHPSPLFQNIKYTKRDDYEYFERKWLNFRDHIEYYLTKNKEIVALFSKYENDVYNLECIEKSGYKLIEPIYDNYQKTFIKVI